MNCSHVNKSRYLVIILLLIAFILFLSGCKSNGNALDATVSDENGQPVESASSDVGIPSEQAQEVEGDGNLTFTVNINKEAEGTPGLASDSDAAKKAGATDTIRFIDAEPPKYLLAFTIGDALGRLPLIPPEVRYLVEVKPGIPLVVNSTAFYKQLSHDGLVNPLKVQVVVVRAEDPFMRNPLSEPIDLTFLNDKTCNEGYDFEMSVVDESLTSLFEAGSLVIRLVGKDGQPSHGGYLNLIYLKPNLEITFNYGRGISGGDFIIELTPAQMMEQGISHGTMNIIDFENNVISDSIDLHFDENGLCLEGRFIEFTLKDPVK